MFLWGRQNVGFQLAYRSDSVVIILVSQCPNKNSKIVLFSKAILLIIFIMNVCKVNIYLKQTNKNKYRNGASVSFLIHVLESSLKFTGAVWTCTRSPSSLSYKTHFSRQLNYWSLRCSRCSNYIFILNLTRGFNGLGKDSYKMRRETFKFWDLVWLILETLQ